DGRNPKKRTVEIRDKNIGKVMNHGCTLKEPIIIMLPINESSPKIPVHKLMSSSVRSWLGKRFTATMNATRKIPPPKSNNIFFKPERCEIVSDHQLIKSSGITAFNMLFGAYATGLTKNSSVQN
ncbi:hypothetical protein L6J37_13120, partial [Photobacterium sp. WH77]|uniref:hypothetical protein n=1 Tax=unclassified Photobacterium TaxID=2628852 RepID=UPI001EDB08B5